MKPVRYLHVLSCLLTLAVPLDFSPAFAQTGVDDDRVSLPEGPGSLEGVGDDVAIDPNMGSMAHSIAIDLPTGFPSATPSLTLSYSSAAPSGPLGIGWSLKVPMIGRMTSRGAPDYDTDDLFDVGGDELVRVGADNGDLIYRSRFEKGFERHRWVAADSGLEGYWVTEHPDGSRSYFGADASGTIVAGARKSRPQGGTAEYCLVETVDQYGHSVRYSYAAHEGTIPLLVGISWLDDGTGADDVYSVEVLYEARPDLLSDASRGYEELLANRVSNIRVYNDSAIVREYVLTYQDDVSAGGFSRLAKVEKYGVGGLAGGPLYPIVHGFDYSQALGVECTGAACDRPYLVPMGSLSGGVNIGNGLATLVDINGDALPDVLDTTNVGAHRFFLNTLTPNAQGGLDHGFSSAVASTVGTGGALRLGGSGQVQVFDVNGDGRSDLLDTNTGRWVENGGDGDWARQATLGNVDTIRSIDFADVRFIDIDDDKRVDLITSTSQTTTLYHNDGDTFSVDTGIDPIGAAFGGGGNMQFADMNGDGLNDPVEIRTDGTVRYRLNLGHGNWSAWRTITGLTINAGDVARADLEDLNGDGVDDVVVVGQTSLAYAINRNGDRFDAFVTVTTADIDGSIPERLSGTTVLYADMNANGSEDIVWFSANGNVTYLELFPRRPNLLTRITNGIGSVQEIAYTTAAVEAARANAEGTSWTHRLSIPMQLVSRIDRYVTLTGNADGTGLHEITMMSYRDGFYDGVEKQYRGFERVESVVAGDDFQEESVNQYVYDVGRTAPHRNGLTLSTTLLSDGRNLSGTTSTYEDCDVAEVPDPATLIAAGRKAVYFPCETVNEVVHKEGLTSSSSWKAVRTEMSYDGYGNVTLNAALGVVGVTGDELYTKTEYVTPTSRWLIGLPSREQVYDAPGNTDYAETLTYYDGDAFVGLALGEATHGFVSRTTTRVDEDGTIIEAGRARRDEHGNSVETIDPNGTVADTTKYHRTYTFDETGRFLIVTDLHNVDEAGQPYTLRRESRFERNFQRVVDSTKWMVVRDGSPVTNRDSNSYRYDDFGRMIAEIHPGDDLDKPSYVYAFELADPVSRIRVQSRSTTNGPLDEESFKCIDGKGRSYQTRSRISSGRFQVSGFTNYNARGNAVQVHQPFVSSDGACDFTVDSSVLSTRIKYDALAREIETIAPGTGVYGEDTVQRVAYLPLETRTFDAEDTTEGGEHFDTPLITTTDGLGRTIEIERTSMEDGNLVRSGDRLFYDSTGTFSGYENAEGHRHLLTTDLVGRTIQVDNPNLGTIRYALDDASNIIAVTDARGVVQRRAYDGQNRITERWDEAARDSTLVSWHYDFVPEDCEATACTNVAGQLAAIRYPVALVDGAVADAVDYMGYDVRRRTVLNGRRIGDLVQLETRRVYDNKDRLVSTTSPDGTVVPRSYDDMGRLTSIDGFVTELGYEDRNRFEHLTFTNGASARTTYDDLLRVSRIHHTDGVGNAIHDLTITRDRADNVKAVADSAGAAIDASHTLRLDDWYRTTDVTRNESSEQFAFDVLDRMRSVNGVTQVYDDAQPLAVRTMGSLSMDYDAAGQLVGRNGMTMDRDELGRIRTVAIDGVTTGAQAYGADDRVMQMTADGSLVVYGFDRFELRDGVATTFVTVDGHRVARHESTDLSSALYADHNDNGRIDAGDARSATTVPAKHVLGAAASTLLLDGESAKTFLHVDHLGSHVAATDADGTVRGRQAFMMHGETRVAEGYVGAYGFTGQERDVTTGLVHMRHRDLDPTTGRWDRFDPAFITVSAGAMSAMGSSSVGYAYAGNNPGSASDPSGLWPWGKKSKSKSKSKRKKKKGYVIGQPPARKQQQQQRAPSAAPRRSHNPLLPPPPARRRSGGMAQPKMNLQIADNVNTNTIPSQSASSAVASSANSAPQWNMALVQQHAAMAANIFQTAMNARDVFQPNAKSISPEMFQYASNQVAAGMAYEAMKQSSSGQASGSAMDVGPMSNGAKELSRINAMMANDVDVDDL